MDCKGDFDDKGGFTYYYPYWKEQVQSYLYALNLNKFYQRTDQSAMVKALLRKE